MTVQRRINRRTPSPQVENSDPSVLVLVPVGTPELRAEIRADETRERERRERLTPAESAAEERLKKVSKEIDRAHRKACASARTYEDRRRADNAMILALAKARILPSAVRPMDRDHQTKGRVMPRSEPQA